MTQNASSDEHAKGVNKFVVIRFTLCILQIPESFVQSVTH